MSDQPEVRLNQIWRYKDGEDWFVASRQIVPVSGGTVFMRRVSNPANRVEWVESRVADNFTYVGDGRVDGSVVVRETTVIHEQRDLTDITVTPVPPGVLMHRHHVLVVGEDHSLSIDCPYASSDLETRAQCAYLEPCGCQQAYLDDVKRIIQLLGDSEWELDLIEWVEGCLVPLVDGNLVTTHERLHIVIPGHEDCPKTGLTHQVWEGEIMTTTGDCSYRGQIQALGRDLVYDMDVEKPGRYPVKGTWDREDFYLELAESPNA